MTQELLGRRVLVPESREQAVFVRMLEERGAIAVTCPMFAIRDALDPAPVADWLNRFIVAPCDDLVILTGEGLRRLVSAADRTGAKDAFIAALGRVRTFVRGPKPVRALREIGLEAGAIAPTPTTAGVIELLAGVVLKGRRVGVQLYPEQDPGALFAAISAGGGAVDPVLPYSYDREASDGSILEAIAGMAQGRIDAVAFTNAGQVRRFVEVARAHLKETELREGLTRAAIAAVGPLVEEELAKAGFHAAIVPAGGLFFMKPLVKALADAMGNSV
ncbi:uroporphyrinogen-III synthase [Methylocapsa aurea]|uniref:uroporphyrinogen-III synthase n=1 Tax=Methylocapsa aurea TaxID=663610 RepID=UPI00056A9E56|nr:uroporphyrinogen-III synthase [Methylocapsa aurea]